MAIYSKSNASATLDGQPVAVLDLDVRQDMERVDFAGSEQDPAWRFTDGQGHEHAPETYVDDGGVLRVKNYPTIERIVDGTHWCEDCREWEENSHLACRQCGEEIRPGVRPAEPMWIRGLRHFEATILGGPFPERELTLDLGEHGRFVGRVSLRSMQEDVATYVFHGRPLDAA